MKALWFSLLTAASLAAVPVLHAELKLPAIFGDHMVFQQKQLNPVWGWDAPGTRITVSFAGQTKTAQAGPDGRWQVQLDPLAANDRPQTLVIVGSETKQLEDVLVGEVWMCSGQSNMGFTLGRDWNGDLEAAAAKLPNLRLIKVPQVGTQALQLDFKGKWRASAPETASGFSAVGFLFGRYLHQILGVPVGLIDNAWGGSAAEAWVRRESFEKDTRFKTLLENATKRESELQTEQAKTDYQAQLAKWKEEVEKARAAGKPAPGQPPSPQQWLAGNARPGNIFAGVVHPTLGYGIKGVIWYQGEANAGRPREYADLFPFMIEQWRKEWRQGDFPFYWVQLADFKPVKSSPADSDWAELRESQTKTLKLPNTGQAVIIDLGEGKDIHPRNKHDVAARLVRWALVKDYGLNFPYRSPEFKSMEIHDAKVTLLFDCFGSSLRAFDVNEAVGFALCGADKVWHWAKGTVQGKDKVEVWSDQVPKPIAVRYAWADNPVCNLSSDDGLPVTPFRTDTFETATAATPAAKPALPTPTLGNVKYGDQERNVLDFWRAKSDRPAPILVYIHGGGWRGGDKSALSPETLDYMLQHGVSVASINYRYSEQARLPAPVHDAARAVQFIRSKAGAWNLNKERVAAMGGSAGACTTLWLAYHDDLANPKSEDPIARESTRLCAGVGVAGQTSIDPEVIVPWVGDNIMNHGMIWRAVGAKNRQEVKERYPEFQALYQEFSPINHVSKEDPPVLLYYPTPTPLPAPDAGTAIHHAMLGQKLKEKADAAGAVCLLEYDEKSSESALVVSEFLVKQLRRP